MNEIKQTLQQDADALLKRLQQSRKNETGVTLSVSDVGVLCEVLGGGGWISVNDGVPALFGMRVKILKKSWDEDDNQILTESEATFDKDSDFSELSYKSFEYETWFDHKTNKYLEEDEITHWMPLPKPPVKEAEGGYCG